MRCDSVLRELSAPGGDLDSTALAAHLAVCPRCASWAAQVERLDKVWEWTSPPEPSPEAFHALWNRAVTEAAAPAVLPFSSARWKRWGMAALAGAQAAALLIAAGVALTKSAPVVEAKPYDFRAEDGRPLIVSLDGPRGVAPTVRRIGASAEEGDLTFADFDVLGFMESLDFDFDVADSRDSF